jgi:hypothetical protein
MILEERHRLSEHWHLVLSEQGERAARWIESHYDRTSLARHDEVLALAAHARVLDEMAAEPPPVPDPGIGKGEPWCGYCGRGMHEAGGGLLDESMGGPSSWSCADTRDCLAAHDVRVPRWRELQPGHHGTGEMAALVAVLAAALPGDDERDVAQAALDALDGWRAVQGAVAERTAEVAASGALAGLLALAAPPVAQEADPLPTAPVPTPSPSPQVLDFESLRWACTLRSQANRAHLISARDDGVRAEPGEAKPEPTRRGGRVFGSTYRRR